MLYFARWKVGLIIAAVVFGILFTLPNFFSAETVAKWPSFLPQSRLVLGLDLQGGAHILMQVERESIVKDGVDQLRDDVRQLLREARIGYTGLGIQGASVQVRVRDVAQLDAAQEKLAELTQPVSVGVFGGGTKRDVTIESDADGLIRLLLTDEGIQQRVSSAVDQSIEVVRRRIDQLGTTEPSIQRQGEDRILIQVPGLQDSQRLKTLLQQTAKLTFHLVCQEMSAEQALQTRPPADCDIHYSTDEPPVPYLIERRALVGGEDLVDAQPSFDQRTSEPIVTFRFNTSGARRFATVTEQNVGRPFAILLDKEVVSAPVIREPIRGGSGQISGNFTVGSAHDLAILLRAGARPPDLTIVERTVGPGLGKDSIAAGETAAVIGAVAVVVFMVLAYGFFGILANIALIANVALIIGLLSLLQATLTLPGIAGIVLTVGMAVDSNVLIYERIREEARAGRSAIAAIDAGFSRALATILDANVTTLIAAVILFQLGSGPVRGFAVTLAIGIATTVFSAFTFTRLLVATWVRARRPNAVPI